MWSNSFCTELEWSAVFSEQSHSAVFVHICNIMLQTVGKITFALENQDVMVLLFFLPAVLFEFVTSLTLRRWAGSIDKTLISWSWFRAFPHETNTDTVFSISKMYQTIIRVNICECEFFFFFVKFPSTFLSPIEYDWSLSSNSNGYTNHVLLM